MSVIQLGVFIPKEAIVIVMAFGIAAACLLLLFLLVFPLLNKYRGTDFPCRNFKSAKREKRPPRGETAADVSWVPTVPLPEMTGKPARIRPSAIRTTVRTDRK